MPLNAPFGVDCPQPDVLRTGDLLFPRVGTHLESLASPKWIHTRSSSRTRIADTIRARAPLLHAAIVSNNAQALLKGYTLNIPGRFQAPAGGFSRMNTGTGASQFDLDDPRVLMFLYRVLQTALSGLIEDWLKMSIDDFIRSEIGIFLLTTLTAKDPRDSFFVGHLAMVIREHEGQVVGDDQGTAYVIEANITDYSHYRVAVHPYAVETAPVPADAAHLARGWANRRLAIGEKVWLARPTALPAEAAPDTDQQRDLKQDLAAQAKALHGRPFGFFDNPVFGDTDRMYCAEFLFNVFRSAGAISIADNRSWGWVKGYLTRSGQTDLAGLVGRVAAAAGLGDVESFFVLTPPMIWSSAAIQQTWNPMGQGGYSP